MLISTALMLLAFMASGSANVLNRAAAKCNADNCARAVTGTAARLPKTRLADCSSYLQTTVTPPVVTETETIIVGPLPIIFETITEFDTSVITSLETVFITPAPAKRTVAAAAAVTTSPTDPIPPYASACSGTSRYASACSCAGVTRVTTTLPAETVIIFENSFEAPITEFETTTVTVLSTVILTVPVIVSQ